MLHKRKSKSTMALQQSEQAHADEWKTVQQKAFKRWCNDQLKGEEMAFLDLTEDIQDGVRLIKLVEVLTDKKIGRYNKKPRLRPQKLENVQQALDFILKENIKLVGVGSADIVDGNSKLVLGLIWTLIQHYQINQAVLKAGGVLGNIRGLTPKQALLKWLQSKLQDHPVGPPVNLTSDWVDGRRIGALCDVLAPGSFPNAEKLPDDSVFQNLKEAIDAANHYLGVPKLLSPEDITATRLDERSMMIYLSEFLETQPQEHIPNGAVPSNLQNGGRAAEPERIQVYGPGVEEGVVVGKVGEFYIQPAAPSPQRPLKVYLSGPSGNRLDVCVTPDSEKGLLTCSFQPNEPGAHRVNIESESSDLSPSKITVNVLPCENGNEPQESYPVKAYGPGLESEHLFLQHPCPFTVDTGDLEGQLSIEVIGPNGPLIDSELNVNQLDDGKFDVVYVPSVAGKYVSEITFNGCAVVGSPFSVSVSDSTGDFRLVRVYGEGLGGGNAGASLTFTIDTREAGHGSIDMAIEGPSKCDANYEDHGDGSCDVLYFPVDPGAYKIIIQFDQQDVPGSPFIAAVVDSSKAVASGPGLSGEPSLVGERSLIYLDVEKSGRCEIKCSTEAPNGSVTAVPFDSLDASTLSGFYVPDQTGVYNVNISMYGVPVRGSPFQVPVINPSDVTVDGKGLKLGVVNRGNVIDVKTAKAGPGKVNVFMTENRSKSKVIATLVPQSDTHYRITYTPQHPGLYSLQVEFGGASLDPYLIRVIDPAAIKIDGPGIQTNVPAKLQTHFTVDCTETGSDEAAIKIVSKKTSSVVRFFRDKVSAGVYKYRYQLPDCAAYLISILLEGEEIEGWPIEVCGTDQSSLKIYGPGLEEAIVGEHSEFFIVTKQAGEGSIGLTIEGPAETPVACSEDQEDVYRFSYTPTSPGIYSLNVTFSDKPVDGSPFLITVTRGPPDASKVKVGGLEKHGRFTVDARDAGGSGMLQVGVTGRFTPAEFISVKHNGNFTYAVTYDLLETGVHTISVLWHGVEVMNSPFTVQT